MAGSMNVRPKSRAGARPTQAGSQQLPWERPASTQVLGVKREKGDQREIYLAKLQEIQNATGREISLNLEDPVLWKTFMPDKTASGSAWASRQWCRLTARLKSRLKFGAVSSALKMAKDLANAHRSVADISRGVPRQAGGKSKKGGVTLMIPWAEEQVSCNHHKWSRRGNQHASWITCDLCDLRLGYVSRKTDANARCPSPEPVSGKQASTAWRKPGRGDPNVKYGPANCKRQPSAVKTEQVMRTSMLDQLAETEVDVQGMADWSHTIIEFGNHRGWTYGDLYKNQPGYCNWVMQAARSVEGEPNVDDQTKSDMCDLAHFLEKVTKLNAQYDQAVQCGFAQVEVRFLCGRQRAPPRRQQCAPWYRHKQ